MLGIFSLEYTLKVKDSKLKTCIIHCCASQLIEINIPTFITDFTAKSFSEPFWQRTLSPIVVAN